MNKIRILVVEDSITIREALIDVLKSDPSLEVVGATGDGAEAVKLCRKLQPNVITMDMILNGMTGLEATEQIMAFCPTPILIVSASLNRAEVFRTYDALLAGAVDVLDKPSSSGLDGTWSSQFIQAVKIVARIKVITHPRARLGPNKLAEIPKLFIHEKKEVYEDFSNAQCVVIGTSTGGPGALLSLLKGLGSNFPLPILIVIHISNPFGASFAEWLDSQSPLRVRFAVDKEALPKPGVGCVLLAPPDFHLVLKGGHLHLNKNPERHSCRPSVDELFESVAREIAKKTIACLLTGMGRDGAQGLLAIRKAGGLTMAQDEKTSLIFGMPKEAIELGAAAHILPIQDFAPALINIAQKTYADRLL